MSTSDGIVLRVAGLRKYFTVGGGLLGRNKSSLKAVDGISFEIEEGTTYGLVGESGCGKTTTAKMILLLERPTEGQIRFEGEDTWTMSRDSRKRYKASVQAVFQDPWASLKSSNAGGRHHRRAPAGQQPHEQGRDQNEGG